MASPLKLLREAALSRRNLIAFALITAAINGMVTASVGAWLAQTYSAHQSRRASVQNIADLIYERRARGGMVVSSLRRNAELEELRYRKRAYDEVFVEWNKRIQNNVLQIREVIGVAESTMLERQMQELLVPALAEMDSCLTKGYDVRLAGQDPMPVIEACRYALLHQFTLDCAAGFTDELYRLTRLSFSPFSSQSHRETEAASRTVRNACTRSAALMAPPSVPAPAPPPAAAAPPTGAAAPPSPARQRCGLIQSWRRACVAPWMHAGSHMKMSGAPDAAIKRLRLSSTPSAAPRAATSRPAARRPASRPPPCPPPAGQPSRPARPARRLAWPCRGCAAGGRHRRC